jgi:hypothetical protein
MKATSLTADSKATASTMPRWLSVESTWRVPNRMVNKASTAAAIRPVSPEIGGTESIPAPPVIRL